MNRRGEAELLLRDEGFIATIFARSDPGAIGRKSKMSMLRGLRVSGAELDPELLVNEPRDLAAIGAPLRLAHDGPNDRPDRLRIAATHTLGGVGVRG
jgi:hypothetical protein